MLLRLAQLLVFRCALGCLACGSPSEAARELPLVRLTTGHPGAFFNPHRATRAWQLSSVRRVERGWPRCRADVVSTVTHELSTPLSTMLAVGDTLVRGRVTGPEAVGEYAQMLVQDLTHRKCEVLRYLAARQERVVHRDERLREIWGYIDAPATRSVDRAIARLRKKIDNDSQHPQHIETAHGGGYGLTVSGGRTT